MTANEVIDLLTAPAIMERLGVSLSSVKEARRNGFPASWFDVIDNMGKSHGVDVPRSIFNFRANKDAA